MLRWSNYKKVHIILMLKKILIRAEYKIRNILGDIHMDVKNTKYLQEWILDEVLSEDDELKIQNIIFAFSEYMVATNPDYLYNKTYLNAFVDGFLNCKIELKKKRDILEKKILNEIDNAGISRTEIVIRVDRAWISKSSGTELLNAFNLNSVKSNVMKYEIEYVGEKGFVVANNADITKKYEQTLKEDIELFIKRYKEICGDVQESID